MHARAYLFNLQMANFMGSNNYSAETTSIFDDCNTVDFFKAFVYDTCTANIRKSYGIGNSKLYTFCNCNIRQIYNGDLNMC